MSCGLADLPEEEQRVSLRKFHGQQSTLISVDIGGIETQSEPGTVGMSIVNRMAIH